MCNFPVEKILVDKIPFIDIDIFSGVQNSGGQNSHFQDRHFSSAQSSGGQNSYFQYRYFSGGQNSFFRGVEMSVLKIPLEMVDKIPC